MALMEYAVETAGAASTSHFRKLMLGYCPDSFSKIGAIAWHGPHLCNKLSNYGGGFELEVAHH